MKTSIKGINLIKEFEALRTEAYKCPAGVWTIGYGHTSNVRKGQVINELCAETFLTIDLQKCEYAINTSVTVPLNQNQFDALASFIFNVGVGAFQKSTLLKKLNNSDYTGAADEFDKWIYSNKKISQGLINRRKKEKDLFLCSII